MGVSLPREFVRPLEIQEGFPISLILSIRYFIWNIIRDIGDWEFQDHLISKFVEKHLQFNGN